MDDESTTEQEEKCCHHGTPFSENCGECLNEAMLWIEGRD